MSKKEKENTKNNIENVIENAFNHIKDIVDANTVVGKIIKVTDNNYLIPVSKISVGLISGGGTIPKAKGENMNACSGTGFNIVPIGFVAVSDTECNFLSVNAVPDVTKTVVDMCYKLYNTYIKKDNKEINEDEKES